MTTVKEGKLIIEITHVFPEEFVKDLKQAIIIAVQNQPEKPIDPEEIYHSNYALLELLTHLIAEE